MARRKPAWARASMTSCVLAVARFHQDVELGALGRHRAMVVCDFMMLAPLLMIWRRARAGRAGRRRCGCGRGGFRARGRVSAPRQAGACRYCRRTGRGRSCGHRSATMREKQRSQQRHDLRDRLRLPYRGSRARGVLPQPENIIEQLFADAARITPTSFTVPSAIVAPPILGDLPRSRMHYGYIAARRRSP